MDLKNLDKSNWQTYRFDQIAKNISERVDPNNTDLEVYIGLEHIDSESIHIKRSGTPDDVNGQKLRFYPGDVIFGRRRAYQRKAAIATTDGFCSAHALVLRANPEVIDPQLFPFFLHSDAFMHRAVDISVGSLSPTINWGTLKHQEFMLPPKGQQAKLAELLWAMDEVVEYELSFLEKLKKTVSTSINQFMMHGFFERNGKLVNTKCGLMDDRLKVIQLKNCLKEKPSYGANASAKPFEVDSPRYIRITDIDDNGKLLNEDVVTIDSSNYSDYLLEDDDFLFARTGNTVGKTFLYKNKYGLCVYAGYLIRFKINADILKSKFLFYFTKSLKYENFKKNMAKIGAQPNINSEEYQSMFLPFFSLDVQDKSKYLRQSRRLVYVNRSKRVKNAPPKGWRRSKTGSVVQFACPLLPDA